MRALQLLGWLLAFLSPFLFLLLFPLTDKLAEPPADRRVEVVEVLLSDLRTPPPADAEWLSRSLPLEIRSLGRKNHLWYRIVLADLPFELPTTTSSSALEPWTLSVGAPFGAVAVYRNQQLLAEVGNGDVPYSLYRWPVSINISPSLLQPDDVLYVNFRRPNSTGWVFANYLAPQSELQAHLANQEFMRERLPQWIAAIMCALGVIMLALFWLRRNDREYFWWSLMLFAWALREAADISADPWVTNPQLWIIIRAVALGSFAVFGYIFIKNFLRQGRSVFDPAIVVSGVIWLGCLLALGWAGLNSRELNNEFWIPWVVMVSLLCCVQLARGVVQAKDRDVGSLLMVCWFISCIGVWDYKSGSDPHAVAGYVQYMGYSAGIVMIVFTLILMRRFAGALGEVEQAKAVLEERIEAQKQRLELAYQSQQQIEQERLVLEERERIMQDMHDGIGGQLVQALSIVSQDPNLSPVEPTLRQALDDLRLIIDSLSVPDGSLPMLLASFRHRLVRPVQRAGLKFGWELTDLPDSMQLSQSELLHILRILQESVTNVLKHAHASRLRIATDVVGDSVRIRVTDNGAGIARAPDATTGQGLKNMRRRAAKIGGEISIRAAAGGGTEVSLLLPLERGADENRGSDLKSDPSG